MLKRESLLYSLFPLFIVLSFFLIVLNNKLIGSFNLLFQMVPPFNTGNLDYSLNHYYIDQPLLFWPWMDSLKSSLVSSGYVGYSNLIGFGIEFPYHSNFAPLSVFVNFYRFFSTEFVLTIVFLAQVLICYYGCILVSKHFSTDTVVGVFLSIAFTLNTFFISWINHLFISGPFCFLPLMYFIYLKSLKESRYVFFNIPIILFSLFSGSIQTTLIVGIFILLFLISNRNQTNTVFFQNFVISKIFILLVSSPFYFDFVIGYLENLSNEGGRQLSIFSDYNIVNILKSTLFVPISQFPFVLGSFNSFDLSKFFNVLYGIPHIPYIGTSILMAIICMKKIEKVYFIVPLIIYLSPLKSIVYERVFIVSLFGMFVIALKTSNGKDFNSINLKRLTSTIYIFAGIWILGSLIFKIKSVAFTVENFLLENIKGAYFSYDNYPQFYEERFLAIESDYSIFSFKNFLIVASLFLTIKYLKNHDFKKVYAINLVQLIIFIIFHLSLPLSQDTIRQETEDSFSAINNIATNSRVVVVDDDNFLFFKENILTIFGINDVDFSSDIYRSKIKKIDKAAINIETMNKLDIDYVISQKELSYLNLSLIDSDFSNDSSYYIYKNNTDEKKNYTFLTQNKLEIECSKDSNIEIPINYSDRWNSEKDLKITENNYGGLSIKCETDDIFIVDYLPRFYQLQPHSLGFNAIILLVTIGLFIVRKEKNEN